MRVYAGMFAINCEVTVGTCVNSEQSKMYGLCPEVVNAQPEPVGIVALSANLIEERE